MPNLLDIITDPNPILRKVSVPVDPKEINTPAFQALCDDMSLTMVERDGVGLAAPQIGRNIRLIVVTDHGKPVCMINPTIIKPSWSKEWGEEGCLSVPNKYGQVRRHKRLHCRFVDRDGNERTIAASGLMARVIQHEIDHLDGVLFTDKAKDIKEFEPVHSQEEE